MAYTVKKLAAMSGVSVRTLHFYDEVGLLKFQSTPAELLTGLWFEVWKSHRFNS